MTHLWSPSTGHFYHPAIHGDTVPGDAVEVGERRYRELLDGQGEGRKIRAGKNGRPELAPLPRVTVELLVARATTAIKAEARRRILEIASLERQANDNAEIAIEAYAGSAGPDLEAALDRRLKINAIRSASNVAEATIAGWATPALTAFDATAPMWWPEWSDR